MRRGRRWLLLGPLAIAAFLLLRVALWRPLAVSGAAPDDGFVRVPGVVHVHTTLSDGGGTPDEVIAAARAAGLRFVIITDHNNLDAKSVEGYHDGVLAIVGTEISTTAGHVLGLGIPDPVFRFSGDARDALDDVRDLGGYAFAAHPISARPDFAWSGWELPGPWGLELLNGDSQWRAAGWGRLAKAAALYALNPRYALLGSLTPLDATLARWDALLARRDAAGIAGADAHSRATLGKGFAPRFPSYQSVFALARNYVLLDKALSGDAATDSGAILAALARGRSYVGLDALAPADGFSFSASAGERRFTMGDTVAPGPDRVELQVSGRMPANADVRLLRDGESAPRVAGPGVYRAEVRIPGWDVPWILSNPIYVFDEATAAARAQQAEWPALAPVPEASASLDKLADFALEFDPSSAMSREAGGVRFRLGRPGAGRPHVWCAIVNRKDRDLSGMRGLVFGLSGSGAYRMWVQVRDANPASADEGTEWWFASVKASPERRRIAVPFERMRSLNRNSDGRLDLDKVRAIVFLLDEASVKPGTEGDLAIDDLGVY